MEPDVDVAVAVKIRHLVRVPEKVWGMRGKARGSVGRREKAWEIRRLVRAPSKEGLARLQARKVDAVKGERGVGLEVT